MRVMIIGCGYVGLPLGAELVRRGHEVHGMRRTAANEQMRAAGITPIVGDLTRGETLERLLMGFDWIINTVSSSKGGLDEYRSIYLEGNRSLVATCFVEKYLFTSSTSVYGQDDGSIVTEKCPTEPASATSRILVEAENLLRQAHQQSSFPAIIARLSGIYGPGRGYLFQQFLKSEARILGEGARYLNMIHLQDVIGGLIAMLEKGRAGEVYNLTDDLAVTEVEFFEWLSKRLDRPMPPFVPQTEAPPRKRGLTNKRVSNGKLKTELRYEFRYPTYREGYEMLIRGGLAEAK